MIWAGKRSEPENGILTAEILKDPQRRPGDFFTTEYADSTDKAGNPNAKARKKSE